MKVLEKFFDTTDSLREDYGPQVPRLTDMPPLDYFLWSYVKDKMYLNKPQTTGQFKKSTYQSAC